MGVSFAFVVPRVCAPNKSTRVAWGFQCRAINVIDPTSNHSQKDYCCDAVYCNQERTCCQVISIFLRWRVRWGRWRRRSIKHLHCTEKMGHGTRSRCVSSPFNIENSRLEPTKKVGALHFRARSTLKADVVPIQFTLSAIGCYVREGCVQGDVRGLRFSLATEHSKAGCAGRARVVHHN